MPAGLPFRRSLTAAGCLVLLVASPLYAARPTPGARSTATLAKAPADTDAPEAVVPDSQPVGAVVPASVDSNAASTRAVTARTAVLAGELAMARRQPAEAARQYATALELAPSVATARAATGAALAADNDALALAGARQWVALAPADPEATDALMVTALRAGDADTVVRLGRARLDRPPVVSPTATPAPSPPLARGRHRVAPPPPPQDTGDASADDADATQSPGDTDAQYAVAALILGAQPSTKAARQAGPQIFGRILEGRTVTAGGHEGLAALALTAEDPATADRESAAALAADPRRYTARLLRLRLLARTQRFDEAGRLIAEAGALGQDPAGLRFEYAKILADLGRRPEARAELEKNLAGHGPGDRTEASLLLGVLDLDDNRPEAAKTRFEALLASPRKSEAAYYLGRLAEVQGDDATAIARYGEATSGIAGLEAALRRANLLARAGRFDESHEIYDTLRRIVPADAARFDLAEAGGLDQGGKRAEALALLDGGLDREPDSTPLLYARGILRERAGNRAGAEADLRRFLALNPDDSGALNALAYLLSETPSAHAEALKMARHALDLSPDDAAIQDTWGWLLYLNGRTAEALPPLQMAFAGQADGEIGAHLGEVLWRLGQLDEARRIWERARLADPDNTVLKQTVVRLTGTPLAPGAPPVMSTNPAPIDSTTPTPPGVPPSDAKRPL